MCPDKSADILLAGKVVDVVVHLRQHVVGLVLARKLGDLYQVVWFTASLLHAIINKLRIALIPPALRHPCAVL